MNKLMVAAAALAATVALSGCGSNNLDESSAENRTYEFGDTLNFDVSRPQYATVENWDVEVTGIYAIGTTTNDLDGNCYVITQNVTLNSVEDKEGNELAESSGINLPDVDVMIDGEPFIASSVPNNCDFEAVRAAGYTGATALSVGETGKRVSVEYLTTSHVNSLTGIIVGVYTGGTEYANARVYEATVDDITDFSE